MHSQVLRNRSQRYEDGIHGAAFGKTAFKQSRIFRIVQHLRIGRIPRLFQLRFEFSEPKWQFSRVVELFRVYHCVQNGYVDHVSHS